MSKEFINQHTVEHNGRYICKYFLEGRCIKVCEDNVQLIQAGRRFKNLKQHLKRPKIDVSYSVLFHALLLAF